jgi:O-antigen/teichoic acid export membrane protein
LIDTRPILAESWSHDRGRYVSAVTSAAVIQFTWRILAGALALGSALIVSTTMGLSTQGVIATSVSVLTGVSVFGGSGFTHAVAFAVARWPASAGRVVDRAAVVAVGSSIVIGTLLAFAGPRVLPSLPVLWLYVAIALPFMQLGQLGLGLQQGLGSSGGYLTTYVSQPLVAFGLAAIGGSLSSSSPAVSAWAGPLVLLPFVVQAATVIRPWLSLPRTNTAAIRPLVTYSLRIYPSAVAHFLSYRLDLLLVGGLLGPAAAGVYSLALNGVDAVARFGQTAATLLFRGFAETGLAESDPRPAQRAATLTGAVGLVLGAVLALAVTVIGQARGPEVRTVGVLLALLAIGSGAVSAWTVLASYLAARDRLGAALRVNLALLLTSLLLYLSLIPLIGVYGGAIGTSIGLLVAAVLGYQEAGRRSPPSLAVPDPTRFRNPSGK